MRVVMLARHGQTHWHSPNRYTGRSDVPLDATGQWQAQRLAVWAAEQGFTAVTCSDLTRAVTTAQPTADALGLSLSVDARLREIDFGMAEGLTLQQVRDKDPQAAQRFVDDPVDGHFPAGEHPRAGLARFEAAMASAAVAAGAGTPLIVAHSTIIRLAVCAAAGIPLRDYRRRLPELHPASVSALRIDTDGQPVALLTYNTATSGRCPA